MDFLWFKDLSLLKETGNFSQAAQKLNISQPTLTRRIQTMETWVGALLIDRSSQPVRLTKAGQQMLEAADQSIKRMEWERQQIIEAEGLAKNNNVRFGVQHSITWRFYPSWLQEFEKNFGDIRSSLIADNLPNCMHDLKNAQIDFVIAYAARPNLSSGHISHSQEVEAGIEAQIIGQDKLILVCKPDAQGRPLFDIGANHKAPVPFLRFSSDASIAQLMEPLLHAKGLHDILQVVYENSMSGALRIRAHDGVGVTWLPESLIESDLNNGLLIRTGPPEWVVNLSIYLYRNKQNIHHVTAKIWDSLLISNAYQHHIK